MVEPRRRERARWSGWKRSRSAAAQTRARASALTFAPSARARDAVVRETPAAAATSASVGRRSRAMSANPTRLDKRFQRLRTLPGTWNRLGGKPFNAEAAGGRSRRSGPRASRPCDAPHGVELGQLLASRIVGEGQPGEPRVERRQID